MEFRLPELGEGIYEAEVSRWLVGPGTAVRRGQGLLEMLTDKATMEVPSPFEGTIEQIRVAPGDQVKVGDVVLTYLDGAGSNHEQASPSAEPHEVPKEAPAALTGEAPATTSPAQPTEPLPTGEPSATEKASTPPAVSDEDAVRPGPETRNGGDRGHAMPPEPGSVQAAPAVREVARQLGVDLQQVQGSGPRGRILIEDVTRCVQAAPTPAPVKAKEPTPDYGTPGTRLKFQGLRRKIAEHMVASKHAIPHFTYVDECDVTPLVHLRESLKEPFAQQGSKLTYLPFLVKAAVAALREVPLVNASLDEKAGEIVLHAEYHIGIAVATPTGLVVPVIRHADRKSLLDIAQEVDRLTRDARMGRSRLEDLRGGTFTITSIGNLGGLFAAPIIHHPQVGIVGVGKIVKRPIFDDRGQLKAADMLYLSLAFDHRVLDGAIGTAFGNAMIRQLTQPARLMLE